MLFPINDQIMKHLMSVINDFDLVYEIATSMTLLLGVIVELQSLLVVIGNVNYHRGQ